MEDKMSLIIDHLVNATVVDESRVQEDFVYVDDDSPCLLTHIFSEKGLENKIVEYKSSGEFLKAFGSSVLDLKRFGQAGINAYGFLRNGGRVMACRLLPQDAKMANVMLKVGIKNRNDIPVWERNEDGSFKLDSNGNKIPVTVEDPVTHEQVQVLTSGYELKIVAEEVTNRNYDGTPVINSTPDTIGEWTYYPLLVFNYAGRGKCGNDYGFSIFPDRFRDKQVSDGRRYVLYLYEKDSTGNLVQYINEPIYFSFNPEAKFSEISTELESIEAQYKTTIPGYGKNPVVMNYIYENYEKIIDILSSAVVENKYMIDFLFGTNVKGYPYEKIVMNEDTINTSTSIITLKGGTDGSLEIGATVLDENENPITVTEAYAENVKKALMLKFYNCDVDASVFDERLIDASIVLDCIEFDNEVRQKIMTNFHDYRPDIFKVMCGSGATEREMLNNCVAIASNGDASTGYTMAVFALSGVTEDPSLPRQYRVLGSYEIGLKVASLYRPGNYDILAGFNGGRIQYIKPDVVLKKTKDDIIGKYIDARINFVQQITKNGTVAIMSDRTLYDGTYSKLSSIRNGFVVGDAIRTAKKILVKYVYDSRGSSQSMRLANEEMSKAFDNRYKGILVMTKVYQTERDKKFDMASADIVIYFPDVPKGFNITVTSKRLSDLENQTA